MTHDPTRPPRTVTLTRPAIALGLATFAGIPVSTTHTITGSISGTATSATLVDGGERRVEDPQERDWTGGLTSR